MSGEQLGLFSVAPAVHTSGPGEPERRRPAVRSTLQERPSWAYYAGPHRACTECVRQRHEGTAPDAGPIAPGKYRRKFKGQEQIMCTPHALHWRTADGYDTALPSAPNRKK